MINKPKKHHYLAQSYLKNFASTNHRDKIFFQRRGFKKPILKTIEDVACVGHFYTFENQSGEKDYTVETGFFGMLRSGLPKLEYLKLPPRPLKAARGGRRKEEAIPLQQRTNHGDLGGVPRRVESQRTRAEVRREHGDQNREWNTGTSVGNSMCAA